MHDIVLPATIWEMKDGKLVKVKIDDTIFALEHEREPITIIKQKRQRHYSHVPIQEAILLEIDQALSQNRNADISDIILKHLPDVTKSTLKIYKSGYKKELQSRYPHKYTNLVKTYTIHRTRRKKPAGTVAYSKSYRTYIKQENIDKVIRAINTVELNYKPTTTMIMKRTGLSEKNTQSTIRYLLDNDKITYRIENKKRIYFQKYTFRQPAITPDVVLKELSEGPFTIVELAKRLECSKEEIKNALHALVNKSQAEVTYNGDGLISYKKV